MTSNTPTKLLTADTVRAAAIESLRKLSPRVQVRNPVMFVVYIGSIVTTGLWLHALITGHGEERAGFIPICPVHFRRQTHSSRTNPSKPDCNRAGALIPCSVSSQPARL